MRPKKGYKVLIVDGAYKVREALEVLFCNRFGCSKVHVVSSGVEAWDIIRKYSLDLVICNRKLQGISGFELLLKIRESKRFQHLPVLIIFNKEDQESALKALHLGATDFIAKPFSPRDFTLKIRKMLFTEDHRADERFDVPFESKVTIVDPSYQSTSGTIVNIGTGGLLAQMSFSRTLSVYDRGDLRLQFLMSKSTNLAKTIQGQVIRVEWDPRRTKQHLAYYAFQFAMLREDQIKFLREVIELLEIPIPELIR